MNKVYTNQRIINSFFEEDCKSIQKYLIKSGLNCKLDKILPTSGTIKSRYNCGCVINYNKNDKNDKIIKDYIKENSFLLKFFKKYN
jgi:hypothetical protein